MDQINVPNEANANIAVHTSGTKMNFLKEEVTKATTQVQNIATGVDQAILAFITSLFFSRMFSNLSSVIEITV